MSQNGVPGKEKNMGSTLYLLKKNDRVVLTVDGDWSEWWTIYPHPKDFRYLVVEARQQRDFLLWAKKISYSELGVKDFSKVLLGLFLNTDKYMEKFTGKKSDIVNIVIEGDSVEINNFGLDVFSYNKPKFVSGDARNVEIVVLKFDNRFEIVVSDPAKLEAYLFKIRRSPDNRFEVEDDDGKKSGVEFGAGNVCELFAMTLLNPRPVVEKILNEKVFITKITVENLSREDEFGFGDCKVIEDFDIPFIEKVLGNYDRMFDDNCNKLMYKEWTLVIEKYGDGKFGFYLKDDPEKRKWVIEPHDVDDSLFVLTFMRDGYEIVSLIRKYYDYGSANVDDLLAKILGKPQIMLGSLTNVSARISNVEVVDKPGNSGVNFPIPV
jgi:hypothetical protein